MGKLEKSAICVIIAAVWRVYTGNFGLIFLLIVGIVVALLAAGGQVLDSWREKRPSGQQQLPTTSVGG